MISTKIIPYEGLKQNYLNAKEKDVLISTKIIPYEGLKLTVFNSRFAD